MDPILAKTLLTNVLQLQDACFDKITDGIGFEHASTDWAGGLDDTITSILDTLKQAFKEAADEALEAYIESTKAGSCFDCGADILKTDTEALNHWYGLQCANCQELQEDAA